eukprot:166134-Rhodomonas_salina.1
MSGRGGSGEGGSERKNRACTAQAEQDASKKRQEKDNKVPRTAHQRPAAVDADDPLHRRPDVGVQRLLRLLELRGR